MRALPVWCVFAIVFGGAARAADIGVIPTKLIVVDKLTAAGKAKAVFVAKDPAATKGAGEDVEQISVRLDVAYGNGSAAGAFVVPAGTASGWLVNKESVAKYVNKDAPGGPTEAKVAVVKPGKLLKLVGKGLGDVDVDVLGAGDPAGSVYTAYCVTNGAEENCHCSELTGCAWKSIAGGTGAKLVCKTGGGDATCSAIASPTTTVTTSTTSTSVTMPLPSCSPEASDCGSCGEGVCVFRCDFGPHSLTCADNATAIPGLCSSDADCPVGKLCFSPVFQACAFGFCADPCY